jgi:hypothetical protein
MAIIKEFETPQGVEATYHKLLKAEIDAVHETVTITVAIFASPEARASGKNVLWHEYQSIPFTALTQDPRDLLYPMLAYYGASFLRGGVPDQEGNGAPGNFEINLKPEAMLPPEDTTPEPVPIDLNPEPITDPAP